jgi:hypothetical protein
MGEHIPHKIKISDFAEPQRTLLASSSADEKKIFQTVDIVKREIFFIVRTNTVILKYCKTIEEAIEIYNRS